MSRLHVRGIDATGTRDGTKFLRDDGVWAAPASGGSVGSWATYAPAWTADVSNPSLGNGTLVGRYVLIGKTVHYLITLTVGSTTTFGSGFWMFSLPVTAITRDDTTPGVFLGHALAVDLSAGANVPCVSMHQTSSTVRMLTMSGANVTPTAPFTWANTDRLRVQGAYQAA